MAKKPLLLTKAKRDNIVRAVKLGVTRRAQARAAGVSLTTLETWIRKGRKSIEPYAELVRDLDAHERDFEIACMRRIEKAARAGDWNADRWVLERRLPRDYGRRMDDAAVQREARRLMEELLASAEARARANVAPPPPSPEASE